MKSLIILTDIKSSKRILIGKPMVILPSAMRKLTPLSPLQAPCHPSSAPPCASVSLLLVAVAPPRVHPTAINTTSLREVAERRDMISQTRL